MADDESSSGCFHDCDHATGGSLDPDFHPCEFLDVRELYVGRVKVGENCNLAIDDHELSFDNEGESLFPVLAQGLVGNMSCLFSSLLIN